ncbi:MAG TPA: UvrD-helicase domain-containing protein [Candidatus Didemnitutus sp.]|nr:UvrD-helicase domain-containing protein [Candidatus Didemnitutus sp.]
MTELPADAVARERFRREWDANFAVGANAGSGKTTAISERLAAMALSDRGEELLRKTAVVTFTRKAAAQIGQRARSILLRRLREQPAANLAALDHLERAFFGTIHSFCLLLGQRHGRAQGLHRNPEVVDDDTACWDEFLEQDAMEFHRLSTRSVEGFLRHAPLESIFALARELTLDQATELVNRVVADGPPPPSETAHAAIAAAATRGPKAQAALRRNQETIAAWRRRLDSDRRFLAFPKPEGTAGGIVELYASYFAPVKAWVADAGAVLAAELALRYRDWRLERGIQTYADQVEAARQVLTDPAILDRVRGEGWRVLLDEAQDTDPQQFSVLVEIARPPGAPPGTWPARGGPPPLAGRFSLVGDPQQSIYGSRANVRNFQEHLEAFGRGDGGERLTFDVTFRVPRCAVDLLNATLPDVFGPGRGENLGLPAAEGAPSPLLQVPYEPLVAASSNEDGSVLVLPLPAVEEKLKVDEQLAREAATVAAWLREHGPAALGVAAWGEVGVIAPRNSWLPIVRDALEAAGIRTALQSRRSRVGDNPAYAWTIGLMTIVVDPENTFEWTGVLREIFGVSDALLAQEIAVHGRFFWEEPNRHEGDVARALTVLQPWIERAHGEGEPLDRLVAGMFRACALEEKARRVDAGGSLAELARLQAEAAEIGLEGGGPTQWLEKLRLHLDDGRPAGKASDDALGLMTSHSAKGLEWPVVIVVGLWREIRRREGSGLQLVTTGAQGPRVYFDPASLPPETREAQDREKSREDARLLYVTLTRARRLLILPWGPEFADRRDASFSGIWDADLSRLPTVDSLPTSPIDAPGPLPEAASERIHLSATDIPSIVRRLLPHQLAEKVDVVRAGRHESSDLDPVPRIGTTAEPLEYGTWWHETMEFMPWAASGETQAEYIAGALAIAEARGFAGQGRDEIERLMLSDTRQQIEETRWRKLSEASLLAEISPGAWMDGVVDLLLHDPDRNELLVLDWKTNRRSNEETEGSHLERLQAEYRGQLEAYRTGLGQLFPKAAIRVAIYASATGACSIW